MHSIHEYMQGYSYYGEVRLGCWFILAPFGLGNGPHWLGNGPHVLGNGPHVLGNGPHVLGNGPHVLGNGLYLCTQFMNTELFLLWGG